MTTDFRCGAITMFLHSTDDDEAFTQKSNFLTFSTLVYYVFECVKINLIKKNIEHHRRSITFIFQMVDF